MSQQYIGKYRIDSVLGRGGMGVVYKAFDPYIARTVAIKTIHKYLLEGSLGHSLLKRFRHEAQAAGRLTHRNIIGIYEYEEDNKLGTPFFVMEYVEGRELKDYLNEGVIFPFEQVLDIISQVLDALAYTHSLGIIHRDIKPSNIILLQDGTVKIADFGIAKLDTSDLTQAGGVLGTPSYMSPEQCLGQPVDARSDLFSTGIVLYELLTGNKAFPGRLPHIIIQNIIHAPPAKPNTRNAEVVRFFNTVVKKALAKRPERRFQNAEEFKQAIQRFPQARAQSASRFWVPGALAAVILFVMGEHGYQWYSQQEGIQQEPAVEVPAVESSSATALGEEVVEDSSSSQQRSNSMAKAQQAKIERLLTVARAHLLVGRLVTPQGSNAHHAYQLVLEIDPKNEAARQGMVTVSERLEEQSRRLWQQGDVDAAKSNLAVGLQLFPQHQGLLALQQAIESRQ